MTLLGQMITFALFVWFTMRFVWPPIINALNEREKKIADGLKAAEQGEEALRVADERSNESIREAKARAVEVMERANKQADNVIETAKNEAKKQGAEQLALAQSEIAGEKEKAKAQLKKEVAALTIKGATQILEKEIDEKQHEKMLRSLIESL